MSTSTAAAQAAASALDAAATALRTLAAEQASQDASAPVVRTARVGQAIGRYASRAEIRAFLNLLPVGTQFEDRDGDRYTQREAGADYWEREGGVNPMDYAALTVTSVPATTVAASISEPAESFEVYDGDRVSFRFEGKEAASVVNVNINSGVQVWVGPDETRALIAYLQSCLASQGESVTPF